MLKDYDISIFYHLGKAKIVTDALCRKYMGSVVYIEDERKELAKEVQRLARLGVQIEKNNKGEVNIQNRATSSLVVEVNEKQN